MKKILFIVLLLCWSFGSEAQSFVWGIPTQTQDEQGYKVNWISEDNESIYKVKSKYNLSIFDYEVIVEQFKFSNLEKMGEETVSEQTAQFKYNGIFQLEGAEYVFFASEFKGGQSVLSWQNVNVVENTRSDKTEIAKIKGKNINNAGRFLVAKSDNNQFYAVLQEQMFVKKTNEKVSISLFDTNFKLVKTVTQQYPYLGKRAPKHEIYVSDEGDVYLTKEVKQPKMKPFRTLFYWDQAANKLVEHSLKLEKDLQIHQIQGQFQDGSFFLHGAYTNAGSKSVQFKAGFSGSESVTASGLLAAKFTKGKKDYLQLNQTEPLFNLNLKAFEMREDKTWGLFDRLYVEQKSKSASTGTSFEYDYHYSNTGIYLAMLDNATGKLDWLTIIKDEEPKTTNDEGDFHSYFYHLEDDKLTIFYNDSRTVKLQYQRFPVMEVFDAIGKQVKKQDLLQAGVGVRRDEDFDLSTDTFFELRPGIFLVKAKSRIESKLGKLQLGQ